ncbi:MAG: PAS domain S-box protein [Paludibacter sp.]|nr:PAS domain S-box protein [Paludibacter sp.]
MEVANKIILIIEDDAGLNELLNDSIIECGFQTACALNASEALDWLNSHIPTLILLDYSLPDMVAKEFIAELMIRMDAIPPFVVATGRGDERIAVEMMKLGAKDYIIKDSHFLEMIPMVVTRVCTEIENENKLRDTQQALNESNQFCKQIIDCAQEGVVVYDTNKRIITWNPFMENITGEKSSDILSRYVYEAFPFVNHVGLLESIDSVLQGNVESTLEYYFTSHITGKSYWVSDNVSTMRNAEGQIIGAISTVRDITERKEAEQKIERISKHYQAIIEKSPDGCVLVDNEGHFKYASPSALRMFGYIEEELMHIHPDDVTHPDDLPMVLSNLGKLLGDPALVPVLEYRFKHKNGEWKWIESTFSNLLNDSAVEAIVINFRDISERKQAQETLKIRETYLTAIIENLPGMIWLKDVDSHILLTNTNFAHIFGREKPEDLFGKTDLDFSPKEYAVRYLADDKKVVATKKPLRVEELIYDQKSIKWFETFKMPIFDENNQVIGTSGYSQDVSERKNAEEALRFSEEKFRNMFEISIVGKSLTAIDGRMSVNQAFCDIVGYTADELSRMHWADITFSDDMPYNIREIDSILKGDKAYSQWEKRYIHKDGHLVWVNISIVLLRDSEGNPIHFITEINDITKRKEAESLLNHERELYLDLVNTQPAGIYRIRVIPPENWKKDAWSNSETSPYIMELASERFCEILGLSREEFERNPKILFDLIHPDDQEEYMIRNSEANIKKIPFYWDCRLLINGKVKWVHFESLPRQLQNGELIFTGIIYDITERIVAESALKERRDVLNKLLFANNEFIDSDLDKVDYKKICDNIVEISGAKYASFNLFDEDGLDFTTVAISGIDGIQDKMKSVFGYELQNKKWKHDPVRSEKLKNSIMTRFDSFFELSGFVFSRKISTVVEKLFNIGEAWVVQITKNNKTIGDYTLLFTRGNTIKNAEIVELYASQVGLYLERLNSENALRKSEEIYRNLVMRIPDGVYKSTTDGRFLDVNPAMIKMLGYDSKEEMLKLNIIADLYFNATDRNVKIKNNMKDIMSVFQLKRKDGTGIWIEDHGWYNTDTQGNIISHEGVLRDITERKKAEDALMESERLLRESQAIARLGSYSWDIVAGYWTSSQILDGIFGIDDDFDRSTENWIGLIHPDWRVEMSDYIRKNVVANRERFDKEYKIVRHDDGQECWVHGIGELEFNDLNEPVKLIGTITNVDERKLAEIALHEKMNELINFQRLTVGRELSMIDLKKEVNELLSKLGIDPKYRIVE